MKKRLLLLACAILPLVSVSCTEPCSRLADQVCLKRGGGSTQCQEMKEFADQAGLAERHYCQSALAVIKSLGSGVQGGRD
ncbi:MAG TPA: hypothetical protein PLB35_09800 [Myxococcota bacterium]|nr:hypothetical protein [Myxococcota bacterium]HOA14369.1 hypothetical protein [Myxococcota bacterium]HOH77534.1 hypothetical protein [Myxococcota bacterium]HPV04819.1 hypothetical protein [Myxococcota bacterium]